MKADMVSVRSDFRAMGTDVALEIVIMGEKKERKAREALEEAESIFRRNEEIFSRFKPASELSKINANLCQNKVVSGEMCEVIQLCLKFNGISGGYFDPRIISNLERIGYDKDFRSHDFNCTEHDLVGLEKFPCSLADDLTVDPEKKTVTAKRRIDTTGIAKGWTVDRVADHLRKKGYENFLVDAGGDMYAAGKDKDGKNWIIGIEGLEESRLMLKLENEGIATSGISRKRWQIGGKKFHHLINPKDPEKFSFDIKTVTVIDSYTVEADGRAKVLVIMGKESGLRFANENEIKALFLDYRGNVFLSQKMKSHVIN